MDEVAPLSEAAFCDDDHFVPVVQKDNESDTWGKSEGEKNGWNSPPSLNTGAMEFRANVDVYEEVDIGEKMLLSSTVMWFFTQ